MNYYAVRRVSSNKGQAVAALTDDSALNTETEFARFPDVDSAVKALRPSEPLHCLHPAELARNAALFLRHFPGHSYYAVKANHDPYVLKKLYSAGIHHFDVASMGEVKQVRGLFPHANLAFMHPVKAREAIRLAYFDYGVRSFVLDSFDELQKIREETRNAEDLTLIVRLAMPKGSAAVPLTDKFGAVPEVAVALLQEVSKTARKTGLSFHVGSQTIDPSSYVDALRMTGEVIGNAGISLGVLDVGGGFPIIGLNMEVPPLITVFDAIREELRKLDLPQSCEVWCEPGGALSGTSATVVVHVELRKGDVLYINDGNFGSLRDLCYEKRRNEVKLIRSRQKKSGNEDIKLAPFKFYGPTCESMDFMPGPFMLPDDVVEGDWIAIGSLGAYGQAFRTQYNGFYSDNKVEIQEQHSAKSTQLRPVLVTDES